MPNVLKANEQGRRLGEPRPLTSREADLLRELVASLRAEGLRPMDVYRAIAQRLRQGSLCK
jgi:hypothetical protein